MDENPVTSSDTDCNSIFGASLDAALIVAANGQILDANGAAVQDYGFGSAELKQMNIADLSVPELKDKMSSRLGTLKTSGENFEWKYRRRDGSELPVEIAAQPCIYQGKQAMLWNARDLRQSNGLESELQKQKHFLDRILNTDPGTVYIYDLSSHRNLYVNRHWLSAYGYTPEETLAMEDLSQLFHPEDRDRITASHHAWRDATDDEKRTIEYRIRDKQGGWNWVLSQETPFARDSACKVSQVLGISHDISERKRRESLVAGQNHVLNMIISGAPLSKTLSALIRCVEDHSPGVLGSILLLEPDGNHVRHAVAPSLPAEFIAAIVAGVIGPVAGSCGAAADLKEAVFVEDIASDPLWINCKPLAIAHGLRACWSSPILDAQGHVLGSFAMYYREPGLPQDEHLRLIDTATYIASIAINHHLEKAALRNSEYKFSILFDRASLPAALLRFPDLVYVDVNDAWLQLFGYSREDVLGKTSAEIGISRNVEHRAELVEEISRRKSVQNREMTLYAKSGSAITVLGNVNVVEIDSQEFVMSSLQDITERKVAEARVQQLTKLYTVLTQCNKAIVRCTSETELLSQICRDAVHYGGMIMTWVGMIDEESNRVRPVAAFGEGIEHLDGLEILLDANEPTGRGPTGIAVREDRPYWCQDMQNDPVTKGWRERSVQYNWGSSASLPLHREGTVIGSFSLYSGEANAFDESARDLLVEMATDVSFALDRFDSEAQRERAEESLRQSEQYLRSIIETEPECVKVLDSHGELLQMNPAGLEMLEVDSLDHARQYKLINFVLEEYHNDFMKLHMRVMQGENATLQFEIEGLKGTRRWLETHATPMRDAEGKIINLLGITLDVTERKANEEHINFLANFDSLTGLPNRAQLGDHLKIAISLAKRNNMQLALMFIDLDRFKDINDTMGHSIGDAFLVEIARRIQQALREEDTAARLGGDEFILMLPNSDAKGAAQVAQKILDIISVPCHIDQYDLTTTASIGIAMYPDDGLDLESLSKNADTAMYRAKQDGRSGYRFFTSAMQARATRNMQLVIALRHALELEQLELHYQPQISIDTGRIIGVEALLRWYHPELGNVSPVEFIPVAEDSGLILPIGECVLRTAARQLKHWLDQGCPAMVVAVNLSAVQFRHPGLSEIVARILEEERLPAECLELELTEGVAMHDPQVAIEVINKLHELGIRMSIDDFGTGYSSLNYLKKFKVYKLKIDKSFVRDICADAEDRAIVATIISMSKNLGLQTIAEGVETIEQVDYLRKQGCDEAQGYYFSKPLPASEFVSLFDLRESASR